MAKFAKPAKQALSAIRQVQRSGNLKSVGTGRNYHQALTRAAEYARLERVPGGLHGLSREDAIRFLETRGQVVGQKTLDLDRQAVQSFLRSIGKLQTSERLPVIKSEQPQALQSRAYSREQVRRITSHQQKANALATEIAHASGLRAHELLTLHALCHARGAAAVVDHLGARSGAGDRLLRDVLALPNLQRIHVPQKDGHPYGF